MTSTQLSFKVPASSQCDIVSNTSLSVKPCSLVKTSSCEICTHCDDFSSSLWHLNGTGKLQNSEGSHSWAYCQYAPTLHALGMELHLSQEHKVSYIIQSCHVTLLT